MLSDEFQTTICSVVLKSALVFARKMGHHHRPQMSGYMVVMTSSLCIPAPRPAGLFLAPTPRALVEG
jgi:hypothetical protein